LRIRTTNEGIAHDLSRLRRALLDHAVPAVRAQRRAASQGLLHALNKFAGERGRSLAQLALAWALHDPRVVSVIIGASSVTQLEQNVGALAAPAFSDDELARLEDLLSEDSAV
jgi:aryl-alcohol dehydrogenase-like predicted oxidoreductase